MWVVVQPTATQFRLASVTQRFDLLDFAAVTAGYRMFARGLWPAIGVLLVVAGCGRTTLDLYDDGGDTTHEGGTSEAGVDAGDGGRLDGGDGGPIDGGDGGPEGGIDGGLCQLGCNDGVPCTDDACDPATGACTFVPNNARCPAGQLCVQGEGCRVVRCGSDEFCADGFFCNGAERCQNGTCVRGRPVECASSSCQTNRCDETARNCVGSWRDDDGDGFGPIQCMGGDCDDNNRRVYPGAREICTDGRDNDCDVLIDCDDSACNNAVTCNPPPPTETNCRNGVDDDADGRVDCADSDCFSRPVCQMQVEVCDDGRDNDFDGRVDCADSDCINDPDCATNLCRDLPNPREAARAACAARFGSNCVDTGTASFIGFASPSSQGSNCDVDPSRWLQFCYADAFDAFNCNTCQIGAIKLAHEPCACGENTRTIGDFCDGSPIDTERGRCHDGWDNDADGLVDCQDFDCRMDPGCAPPEEQGHCDDGRDNDFDGLVDCQDPDCRMDPWCTPPLDESRCDDRVDNDFDGAIDCSDSDCFNDPVCMIDLCRDLPNPRAAARAACEARFPSCVDTGSASIIGFAPPSSQGSNCDIGANRWLQFCYADAYDSYNCNTCQVGAIKLAHDPCVCGENTETIGDFCDAQPGFEQGRCGDGFDNDLDGRVDCADSDCAMDPLCLPPTERGACADMIDNDGDGAVDCADFECLGDPVCVMMPECPMFDLGSRTGSFVARGSTVGQGNNLAPSCVFSSAPEVTYRWRAPQAGTWQIDTESSTYDTTLYVLTGGCNGNEIACDDDALGRQSLVNVTLARGQEVVIVVDGWSSSVGTYVLNITSLVGDESGRCDDGIDNDTDGVTDCADPDCFMDEICLAPTCPDAELGSAVGMPVIADSTVGQGNDFSPTCLGMSSNAPDVSYHWRAPLAGRWVFDTFGSQYDTALSIINGGCDGQTLVCNDDAGDDRDSSVTVNLTRGQDVVIVIDGYSRSSGNYVLNIGRIVTNERGQCGDFVDNDADGASDCNDADCVNDPACVQMCEPEESGLSACTDGRDNDCDNLPDCADPDCNALFGGECCNGVDDTGDGLVDVLACGCQTSNDCGPIDSPIGPIPGACWPTLGACGPDCSAFSVQGGNAICRFISPALRCQRTTGQCVISP